MRLQDKVIVVTGGGSGIGRASAIRLAEEGARVVVGDRNAKGGNETVDMITKKGGKAIFVEMDISRVADTRKVIAQAVEKFGRLDVLVNNAGILLEKTAVDTSEEDWDRVIDTNLKGTFFCAKHAILQFRAQNSGGAIVNIASVNSVYAEAGIAAYCASKGGIAQLTRALAIDHGKDGVRVNAIGPGWIETPLNANYFASGPHVREAAGKLHAVGRIGRPEEIANAVVFLASDDASFMTGALVMVDGGFSAGLAPALGIVLE